MKLAGLFFSIVAGCCIISTNRGQLIKFQEHFELYRNLWENRLLLHDISKRIPGEFIA